jgi:DNA modification methylase
MFEVYPGGYQTSLGQAECGDALQLIKALPDGSVDLVMTSPPFALLRPKAYGNEPQDDYVDWLCIFAQAARSKLADTGSLVLDLGGAYQRGIPSRSLHIYKLILKLCEEVGYHLCQDFYWYNPAKLPTPIEWVGKRKIRAKDAVNSLLWLGKTPWPKADVTKVLTPYGARMQQELRRGNSGTTDRLRPSGHAVTQSMIRDNGGSIPSNLLAIPNTSSNDAYLRSCKRLEIKPHPARFPAKLPEFFIRMLTDPGDLVVDLFAGSNMTGHVAETLQRRWRAFEMNGEYLAASALRFAETDATDAELQRIHRSGRRPLATAYDLQRQSAISSIQDAVSIA